MSRLRADGTGGLALTSDALAACPPVHLADCAGPPTSLPDSFARLEAPGTVRMDSDERLANLARTVPGGFAGTFHDSTHTPILLLTQPDRADEAKAALVSRLPSFPVMRATVREARWDFAQLVDWYSYLRPRIPRHVTPALSDEDERINRIHLGVPSIAARDSLVSAISALALPCDLVVVDLRYLRFF